MTDIKFLLFSHKKRQYLSAFYNSAYSGMSCESLVNASNKQTTRLRVAAIDRLIICHNYDFYTAVCYFIISVVSRSKWGFR